MAVWGCRGVLGVFCTVVDYVLIFIIGFSKLRMSLCIERWKKVDGFPNGWNEHALDSV